MTVGFGSTSRRELGQPGQENRSSLEGRALPDPRGSLHSNREPEQVTRQSRGQTVGPRRRWLPCSVKCLKAARCLAPRTLTVSFPQKYQAKHTPEVTPENSRLHLSRQGQEDGGARRSKDDVTGQTDANMAPTGHLKIGGHKTEEGREAQRVGDPRRLDLLRPGSPVKSGVEFEVWTNADGPVATTTVKLDHFPSSSTFPVSFVASPLPHLQGTIHVF